MRLFLRVITRAIWETKQQVWGKVGHKISHDIFHCALTSIYPLNYIFKILFMCCCLQVLALFTLFLFYTLLREWDCCMSQYRLNVPNGLFLSHQDWSNMVNVEYSGVLIPDTLPASKTAPATIKYFGLSCKHCRHSIKVYWIFCLDVFMVTVIPTTGVTES